MPDLVRSISSSTYDTVYIRNRAIKTLEKKLVLAGFATPGDLPNNAGSRLRFHIDSNLSTATTTTALTSSSPITFASRDTFNEDSFLGTGIETQINTYGAFVPVRTRDLKQMPKGMMDRLGDRLAYRGKLTLDTLLRAAIDGTGTGFLPSMGAGTTTLRRSIRAGNNQTLVAGDQLTAEDVALGVGDLLANDAEPFSNGLMAVVVHTVPRTHLITDVSTSRITWEQVNKYVSGYNGQEKLLEGSPGAIAGGMVVVSNNIAQGTIDTIANTYFNLVLAQDGLGNVQQDDMKPQVYINKPDSGSTDNPYRIYATASFLFSAGPTKLDNLRSEVLYSAP